MPRVSLSWVVVLGLLSAIGPLCTDFYLPALPEITEQLSATGTQTQLSLTAALLGLGLGQMFFGPLSDRIGRRKPLALSLLLFIFSSAMCAVTQDIHLLIAWRFLQGFAGAGGSVLSRSIARDRYQGTLLTQFFALLMTVNGIAPVLSPVLGGYIITAFDWRILFWTMAAIGVVLLVLSLTVLHETLPAQSASTAQQQKGTPVLKNRRFMRYCLIQAFMMAGLFSYIGSSSFVMQSEYGMSAMQFSLLFGLIFGIYSATHSGSVGDYILTVLAFIGVAVPSFFLALGSVYVFSLKLSWFPTGAMRTIGVELTGWSGFVDVVRHMTLPAIVMALPQTASITRYARSSMLDVIHEDFIRTARAKGLGEKRVIFVHALRNALIPIITLFGLSLPGLLGGSYIVESIFNWPGLGTLGIKAITAREYSELMALNLITAVLVLLGNFIADMLYTVADPRIRVSKGKGE